MKKIRNKGVIRASPRSGREIEHPDHTKIHEVEKSLMKMLKGAGFENVRGNEPADLSGGVMWLNSVYQFFYLGLEKQREGLNPRIYISW